MNRLVTLAVLFPIPSLFWAGMLIADPQSLPGKTLYQWTDTDGKVYFSDRPPAGPVERIQAQELPVTSAPSEDTSEDFYSVENQARRLEEERRARADTRDQERREREERELREAQLKAAKAQQQAARAQQQAAERDRGIGVPIYWRPIRPPVHPIRPEPLPGHPVLPPALPERPPYAVHPKTIDPPPRMSLPRF